MLLVGQYSLTTMDSTVQTVADRSLKPMKWLLVTRSRLPEGHVLPLPPDSPCLTMKPCGCPSKGPEGEAFWSLEIVSFVLRCSNFAQLGHSEVENPPFIRGLPTKNGDILLSD